MTGARACIVLFSLAASAAAVELDELDVAKDGDVYLVRMSFDIASPPEKVVEVLTDFDNPYRLNPDVVEREIISNQDGITRVRTKLRSCFLFFCKDLKLMQDVKSNSSEVLAVIVPEQSDFRSGTWRWTINHIDDDTSYVSLQASMEPDVPVPPLFRRFLEREVRAIAVNLESEASKVIN